MMITTPNDVTPATLDDRGTSFVPVQGTEEMHGGGALVVAAYGLVWALTFVWLVGMWRKQAALRSKVDLLDAKLQQAMQRQESSDGSSRS